MMQNLIPLAIVLVLLAAAGSYLWRAKKRGVHCVGCPGGCSGSCGGCGQGKHPKA